MDERPAPTPSIAASLESARIALERDVRTIFGHADARATLDDKGGTTLAVSGRDGRFDIRWPPTDRLTRAEGRLGAHARIAFELLLASETPAEFFAGYRPQAPARRRAMFDALDGYIDETLRSSRFYGSIQFIERGPVALVYGDDEYALVADDGHHKGRGLLHWKVKRLVAYALTDADEVVG